MTMAFATVRRRVSLPRLAHKRITFGGPWGKIRMYTANKPDRRRPASPPNLRRMRSAEAPRHYCYHEDKLGSENATYYSWTPIERFCVVRNSTGITHRLCRKHAVDRYNGLHGASAVEESGHASHGCETFGYMYQ